MENVNENDTHYEKASFISKVLYMWMNPLIKLGSTRPLEEDDIYSTPKGHASQLVLEIAKMSWASEVKKHGKNAKYGRSLINSFWKYFFKRFVS